jgi:hypothetical protein
MQGLLGDWRSQFSGYQPQMQQPQAPNLQATMLGQPGSQTPAYGLSPEFIGLLSQQFPGMNFNADQQAGTYTPFLQQLQGLLSNYQGQLGQSQQQQPGSWFSGTY